MKLSKALLKDKIEKLKSYYKQYPREDREEKIKKIESFLDNQEYKIAVVANMSAGKSTFINSLFGKEVLPAFTHATTDCATFIYSKPNIDKKAIIYFNDEKESVEITDNLETEIKQYAQKDEECEDEKYKNVEKIELYYPFKNLQTSPSEDFSITFIDTPGPNSTGEGYKQKHKDQTRRVLKDVDMALFMFDYEQLDANLESDEQGLWNTIRKRYEKDEDFDIFFLINKIDSALNDNFKEITTKDKDEFIQLKRKNWHKHEQIAINKIENAAKKHAISDPKIYPISSKYQLLHRDNNKNWDAEDDLESFQKSHFKRLFNDGWEEKFIDYLGILKLEQDINNFINTTAKEKTLLKINDSINSLIYEEKQLLDQKVGMLKKPKKQAEENLRKSKFFLENKTDEIEQNFIKKSKKIQKKYIEEVRKNIDNAIEYELNQNIDETTERTIKFLELLLTGYSEQDATSSAKNLPYDKIKHNLNKKEIKIPVKEKVEVESIERSLQNFIKSILNDYKNNYLDMKIEIKNNYRKLSQEISTLFNNFKKEFDKELNRTLNIETPNIDEESLYIESIFDDNIKVPDSTIDYKYRSEKWEKGGSFTGRKKVRDEEHSIIISPENIKKIFKNSINSIKRVYYNNEIKTYENSITQFIKSYQDKFNVFKETKKEEIKEIEKDLINSEENLSRVLEQFNELKNL